LFAAADKVTDLGLKVGVLGSRVLAPVLFAQSHQDAAAYARTCSRATVAPYHSPTSRFRSDFRQTFLMHCVSATRIDR